jgi:hypothetical protein
MMVIFLTGLVSMILMRTLRNDYAKYAREDDDLETLVICFLYVVNSLLWLFWRCKAYNLKKIGKRNKENAFFFIKTLPGSCPQAVSS